MSSWQERRSRLVNLIVVNAVAGGFGISLLIIGIRDNDKVGAGIGVILVLLSPWIMRRTYQDLKANQPRIRLKIDMKV